MAPSSEQMGSSKPLPASYRKALKNHFHRDQVREFTSKQKKPLFYYGSLMLPAKVKQVIHTKKSASQLAAQMTPARLYGYERRAVKYAAYPAVIASKTEGAFVDGFLMFGLSDYERQKIDWYESGLYNLTTVPAEIQILENNDKECSTQKEVVDAQVYVWRGSRGELERPGVADWSVEKFLTSHMAWGLEEENDDQDRRDDVQEEDDWDLVKASDVVD